jgi:hypothetical protein
VAADRADSGIMAQPDGAIADLTYEEGQDYLQALVGDDETRSGASAIVADQVAHEIHMVGVEDDMRHAQRAGALSEMSVLATAEARLDDAERDAMMSKLGESVTTKILALTPPGKAPVISDAVNYAVGELFSSDHVENALKETNDAQVDAFGELKRLSIASQVAHGHLPPQVLETINSDGTMNLDFIDTVDGRDDVVRSSPDGLEGEPLAWDLDKDGRIEANEREITESELYEAGTGPAEIASDGMISLHSVQQDGANPPSFDKIPLPDGYHRDDAGWFERRWPFDGDPITGPSGEKADPSDFRWDPDERIYHLEFETSDGDKSELHYMKDGDDWKLAHQVNGKWEFVD